MKEKVDVCLPETEDGDGVVEIGVNGTMYVLRRGQAVPVPGEVAEVLINAGLWKDGGGE